MDCIDSLNKVFSYIDGNIKDEETLEELQEHLEHCKQCFDVVDFEKRIQVFIEDSCQCEDIPKEICDRAQKTLNKFRKHPK